VEAMESYRKA